ncbi:MAG: metallophosphoesterase family protein [Proteobacteria bacterium]|nr:metallophosphoesterase family protein [Pseudomonadota bacterium]
MGTRWAVMSDIHGNLAALEAVLADAAACKVDRIAVLGDTIDYGPDPVACLERVVAVADVLLVGNHEEYAVTPDEDQEDSDILRWSMPQLAASPVWQALRARIAADGAATHASRVVDDRQHFVHASAGAPTQQYIWPGHEVQYLVFNTQIDERIREFLEEFRAPHGFNGHTHVPALLTRRQHHRVFDSYEGVDRHHVHTFIGPTAIFFVPTNPCTVRALGDVPFVVNPGSVGQPRRLGDNRAAYVVYDEETVEFRRVAYDVGATCQKLAALPIDPEQRAELIDRLERGV